jgi:hypothetical protein
MHVPGWLSHFVLVPMQVPFLQMSPVVHRLPSSQLLLSGDGLGMQPLEMSHHCRVDTMRQT